MKKRVIKNEESKFKGLLRTELKRLKFCEAIAVPNFMFIYFTCWLMTIIEFEKEFIHTPIVIYPLIILCFILLQGSAYWDICLRRIDGKNTPKNTAKIYSNLKRLNLFLLFLYIPIRIGFASEATYNLSGLFIYLFTILEYINYYVIRISYKNPIHFFVNLRKMKFPKSQIMKEIEKSKLTKNKIQNSI